MQGPTGLIGVQIVLYRAHSGGDLVPVRISPQAHPFGSLDGGSSIWYCRSASCSAYASRIFNPLEGRYYLQHLEEKICFIGHSHQPVFFEQDEQGHVAYDRKAEFSLTLRDGCKYIVNDGSVGQPRDGKPEAAFATYDSEKQRIEVQRFPYNFKKTQQKMTDANLPVFLIERLSHGR